MDDVSTTATDTAGSAAESAPAESNSISLDEYRANYEAEHGMSEEVAPLSPPDGDEVISGEEQSEQAQDDQGQLAEEPAKDNSKTSEPQDGWFEANLPEKFKSAADPKAELLKSHLNLEKHAGQLANAKAAAEAQLRQMQELAQFQQATAGGYDGLTPAQQTFYEQQAARSNYAFTPEQLYHFDVVRQEAELHRNLELEASARKEAVAQAGQYVQSLPDTAKAHVQAELDKLSEMAPDFDAALWGGMNPGTARQFFTRVIDALKAESELAKLKAEEPVKLALAKEEALRESRELQRTKRVSTAAARGTPAPATPNRPALKGESAIDELYRVTSGGDYQF